MNKKHQDDQDRKLLQQFYSRLNISWQERPQSGSKNPLLHRTQNNLISKSLAHKFFNSKRYKLNQSKQAQKKQSAHVFTTSGIVNANAPARRLSQPSIVKSQTKQNTAVKFLKYEKSHLYQISNKPVQSKTCYMTDDFQRVKTQYQQAQKVITQRSIRAMSAHLSSRRSKTSGQQNYTFRKTSEMWLKKQPKKQQKYEVKGWDFEVDTMDINLIDLKFHSAH